MTQPFHGFRQIEPSRLAVNVFIYTCRCYGPKGQEEHIWRRDASKPSLVWLHLVGREYTSERPSVCDWSDRIYSPPFHRFRNGEHEEVYGRYSGRIFVQRLFLFSNLLHFPYPYLALDTSYKLWRHDNSWIFRDESVTDISVRNGF